MAEREDVAPHLLRALEVLRGSANRCNKRRNCDHNFEGPHGYINEVSCTRLLLKAFPNQSQGLLEKWVNQLGKLGLRRRADRQLTYISLDKGVTADTIRAGLAALAESKRQEK